MTETEPKIGETKTGVYDDDVYDNIDMKHYDLSGNWKLKGHMSKIKDFNFEVNESGETYCCHKLSQSSEGEKW